jgi:hypothetical protein
MGLYPQCPHLSGQRNRVAILSRLRLNSAEIAGHTPADHVEDQQRRPDAKGEVESVWQESH